MPDPEAFPRPGPGRSRSVPERSRLEARRTADEQPALAGRAMARRGMGKLVFLDVVDRSGRIQVMCDVSKTGELDIHLGDVVGITGHPAKSRRGEPSVAAETRRGAVAQHDARFPTRSTGSPTSSCATASGTSTC